MRSFKSHGGHAKTMSTALFLRLASLIKGLGLGSGAFEAGGNLPRFRAVSGGGHEAASWSGQCGMHFRRPPPPPPSPRPPPHALTACEASLSACSPWTKALRDPGRSAWNPSPLSPSAAPLQKLTFVLPPCLCIDRMRACFVPLSSSFPRSPATLCFSSATHALVLVPSRCAPFPLLPSPLKRCLPSAHLQSPAQVQVWI